ncbi:MAG: hypothetical protein BGO49_03675 [Planctomycetales bacterium 71-10]|nr:MAG: hypothetical protein BGO49_03675 [Planctomycetales bacterium 71-10]
MTIKLPDDLERSIREAVDSGRFASLDEAMAEAARRLLHQLDATADGSIGAMRDAADELDAIVADAYQARRGESWRDLPLE